MPGTVIKVKWPRGIAKANPVTGSWDLIATMDPNDHYGPWLDAHVGKRGWNWNWKPIIVNGSLNTAEILIKIRKPKDKLASFFLLSIDSEAK